jgi:uncharacterized protein
MQIDAITLQVITKSASNVLSGDFELYLFGSRARGTARKYSDVDVAIKTRSPVSVSNILKISSDIEDSQIAYKVDVVDYGRANTELKINIDRDGVKL